MNVNELTNRLWYDAEIVIYSKEYDPCKENRVLWQGNNYELRSVTAKEIRNLPVISYGIDEGKLVIVC